MTFAYFSKVNFLFSSIFSSSCIHLPREGNLRICSKRSKLGYGPTKVFVRVAPNRRRPAANSVGPGLSIISLQRMILLERPQALLADSFFASFAIWLAFSKDWCHRLIQCLDISNVLARHIFLQSTGQCPMIVEQSPFIGQRIGHRSWFPFVPFIHL